jgi:hypothetical protein
MSDMEAAKRIALGMAVYCVRNTFLEDLHAGLSPCSATGGYANVRVVAPDREFPWEQLSRLDDNEMRVLMQEVVNKIYTALLRLDDPDFIAKLDSFATTYARNWNEPTDLNLNTPRT